MAASTISGIGTADGPEVSTGPAGVGATGGVARAGAAATTVARAATARAATAWATVAAAVRPTRARVAGIGLALLRVLQRAQDVLAGARVVPHVYREDLDRVPVAVQRVDVVDAAVVVPVRDHLFRAALGRGRARRTRGHERRGGDGERDSCCCQGGATESESGCDQHKSRQRLSSSIGSPRESAVCEG